jgi:hypothetical protein
MVYKPKNALQEDHLQGRFCGPPLEHPETIFSKEVLSEKYLLKSSLE